MEKWYPEKGEKFYYINAEGQIKEDIWYATQYQFNIMHFLGIYRTTYRVQLIRDQIPKALKFHFGEELADYYGIAEKIP